MSSSGNPELERAARGAIYSSSPFEALPAGSTKDGLLLQCNFHYNTTQLACAVSAHPPFQSGENNNQTAAQEQKTQKENTAPYMGGGIQILSDTMGVDFGPYLQRVKHQVQSHWEPLVPESAMPPIRKTGTVVIEFAVMKDGTVGAMRLFSSSGDTLLDRAAWGAVTSSLPLPRLPPQFTGNYLRLRCNFLYNPKPNETATQQSPGSEQSQEPLKK